MSRSSGRSPTRRPGKDTARPKLDELIAFVRDGDTVLVHSMDRLARNLDDLRRLVRTLTGKGVRVEFVKESLTFTGEDSPMATLLLSVMGAFAEFERALILERQREGIAAAKQRGVYTGRKPALTAEQAQQLRERAAAGERKVGAGPGVRHQPRDRVQLPAGGGRHRLTRSGARPPSPLAGQSCRSWTFLAGSGPRTSCSYNSLSGRFIVQ